MQLLLFLQQLETTRAYLLHPTTLQRLQYNLLTDEISKITHGSIDACDVLDLLSHQCLDAVQASGQQLTAEYLRFVMLRPGCSRPLQNDRERQDH